MGTRRHLVRAVHVRTPVHRFQPSGVGHEYFTGQIQAREHGVQPRLAPGVEGYVGEEPYEAPDVGQIISIEMCA